MTEPEDRRQPGDDESHASVGGDAGTPGAGRTERETAVDDDLGQGDAPQR
ncbi:hypothetical protein [Geodermatophilus marinus]|nr:hypothetical protein [Geodermatophilus sp. LHW52908]